MSELQVFERTDEVSGILAAIEDDGGVIVLGMIDEPLRLNLIEQLSEHTRRFAPGTHGSSAKTMFWGAQTKRFTGLAAKAPVFAEVIDDELLHHWAEHAFGNDYWMNTGQAMFVGPGSQAQILHRDAGNWPVMLKLGPEGPEATISMMLALSDFSAENGATRVVPGSHRWEDFAREPEAGEITQAIMPAGSALLYSGKTIHGAGENRSAEDWRLGVHLSFALAQLTPEEAHTLMVPWSTAQHFSERVQHMLGYRSHRTFLADWPVLWTAEYNDVRDALAPGEARHYQSAGEKHLNSSAQTMKAGNA